MRRFLLSFLIFLSTVGLVTAQQRPQYSLYMVNNYILNPAITGIEDYADVKIGYRNQWQGIEGAPVTSYFSIQTPVGKANNLANPEWLKSKRPTYYLYRTRQRSYSKTKSHHGIGAIVMADKIGPFQQFEMHFTYAYHLLLTKKIKLSQGISAGFSHYSLNQKEITDDPLDPVLGRGEYNQFRPDLSAGLWLYTDDFYIGASAFQLLGSINGFSPAKVALKSHYFITAGYTLAPTSKVAIQPSVMIKLLHPAPASVDMNIRAVFMSRAWVGVSYRYQESVAVVTGFAVNPLLDIGYAFDNAISGIGNYGNGSHEILLGLRLINRYKVYCPQNMW